MDNPDTFFDILKIEKDKLLSLSNKWQNYLESNSKLIPEDVTGLILTAIGQTNLLLSEKFNQFEDLIMDCKLKRGIKKVLIPDLQGFLDLIYLQIEDLNEKFCNLEKLSFKIGKPEEGPLQGSESLSGFFQFGVKCYDTMEL